MYHWPTDTGHQVSLAFPKTITFLEFFRIICVHNKSFLSTFYQLTESTPKKTIPYLTEFVLCMMQFMLKDWSNQKIPCKYWENIKRAILNIKRKRLADWNCSSNNLYLHFFAVHPGSSVKHLWHQNYFAMDYPPPQF